MEGFIIKCRKCGKEKVIESGNFFDEPIIIEASSRDGDVDIVCNCGNDISN